MKAAIPALERYEVTRATREDAPAILNFLKEVASWVKHKNPQQWRDLLNGKLDDHIMDLIEDHETFIIREDGELVATFSLNEEQLEHDVRLWGKRDDDAVYLHKLAVSPRMIGSGLGKEIIRYAIEYVRAKGKRYLRLDCVAHNEKLVNFYTKCGFTDHGVTNGHMKFRNGPQSMNEKSLE